MADESTFDDVRVGGFVAAAVGAGAGSAADLVLPGLGGPLGVAVAAVGNLVGVGIERRQGRAVRAFEEACGFADLTPNELCNAVGGDDHRIELTLRALSAAAESRLDQKVRALGRALASGALAEHDAIVERETFVVDALARMEAPHAKVLFIMDQPPIPQENGRVYKSVDLAWTESKLVQRYPQAGDVMASIIATMSGVAVIRPLSSSGSAYQQAAYDISDFGRLVLGRLLEAGLRVDR
ncbi:hypothetical protein [Pimelobacter sp. 30-1]|uniref:hypothetical protein n=1 Tax=Pimelobacter sp. 30-1 TaxID=2004991 RepID=UPI001C042DB3|nr:hypothetical protein [Pimelobacter sp. 30-1]MBU2696234.1 hypothetical protein [Pimelobacter sp. 30-1]